MGKTISKVIDDGVITFEFRDNNDEVFSSFRLNPTDVTLVERAMEVSDKFQELTKDVPENEGVEEAIRYNALIEEQLNYMLGYEASKDLFREPMTATTVLPSGQIFAILVLDTILEIIQPEIKKRQAKADKAMGKYLQKYGGGT